MDEQQHLETVDYGLDIAREHLSLQLDTADKLDAKAGAVLAAATLGLTFAISLGSKDFAFVNHTIILMICVIMLASYCCLVACVFITYWKRKYHVPMGTDGLMAMVITEQRTPLNFKEQMFVNFLKDIELNSDILKNKAHWLEWALVCLLIQLAMIAAVFTFETIH